MKSLPPLKVNEYFMIDFPEASFQFKTYRQLGIRKESDLKKVKNKNY